MAEASSFMLKVAIGQPALQKFLQARPSQPALSQAWCEWWDSRQMHGQQPLTAAVFKAYDLPSNQAVIDYWTEDGDAEDGAAAHVDYDAAASVWRFSILFSSHNYSDLLPLVIFASSLQAYAQPARGDYAIIFPFIWGEDDVQAFVDLTQAPAVPDSVILGLEGVPPAVVDDAMDYLGQQVERMAALHGSLD
jgi:hypothetical protein